MAILTPNKEFRVMSGVYDQSKYITEDNYYNQKQYHPAWLTSKMIWMIGKQERDYPLATKLLGQPYFDISDKEAQAGENPFEVSTTTEVLDVEDFMYPVMVPAKRGSEVAKNGYQAGDKPGIGFSDIKLPFRTQALHKNWIIRSPKGVMLYVKDYTPVGNVFEYTLAFAGGSDSQFVDLNEIKEGVLWINMFPAVAKSESRNNDIGRALTPSAYRNQMTTLRTGMSWAGDVADLKATKALAFVDKNPQGGFDTGGAKWIDQYTYNFEVDNLEMIEAALWYQEYNRNPNGLVPLKDSLTGRSISIGSGILQQILHKVTYSDFSYQFFTDLIGRAYYGVKGSPRSKTLYTGTLGHRKFDAAMKRQGIAFLTDWTGVADKFITGSDYNLMLGGYFDGFYHVDGWIIKVKKVNIFDNGLITNSPIDEQSGLPYESGRMIILDDSDVQGESNIKLLLKKGYQPFTHAIQRGFNNVPESIKILSGKQKLDDGLVTEVGTDVDKSTYMRKYVMGVQMLRGNTSLDLQYVPTFW